MSCRLSLILASIALTTEAHAYNLALGEFDPALATEALVLSDGGVDPAGYEKAVDGPDVVLNKLFPKKSKVEFDVKAGMMLNSSYLQTFFLNGGITYFWSEVWGFNVEGYYAAPTDKPERKCVETFYNDPNFTVGQECDSEDSKAAWQEDPQTDANYGPAYVPIRSLKYMFVGSAVWNPIYGKQIILLSATNYFDFFLSFGGGVAMSDYQPKTQEFPDGHKTRGSFCTKKTQQDNPGACDPSTNPGTTDENLVGEAGRPVPISETSPLIKLAVGQRFHFFKRFTATGSLENFTLIGGEAGFENFFDIVFGLGVRF